MARLTYNTVQPAASLGAGDPSSVAPYLLTLMLQQRHAAPGREHQAATVDS